MCVYEYSILPRCVLLLLLVMMIIMMVMLLLITVSTGSHFRFERFVALFFAGTVGRFAFERPPGQLRFGQNVSGLQLPRNVAGALERALHLFPANELGHLFGQLPELFEIDVAVGEPAVERMPIVGCVNRAKARICRG